MKRMYLILLALLVSSTNGRPRVREMVPREVTPVAAELSSTLGSNVAGNAIDRDWDTYSSADPGSDGTSWLKLKLGEVYCVDKVVVYRDSYSYSSRTSSYSCSHDEFTCERNCNGCLVSVYTEGNTTSGNTTCTAAGCVWGDTVKVYREDGESIRVYGLFITKLGRLRDMVPREVTPVAAEQTNTWRSYVAGNAIDRDWGTGSVADPGSDGALWLKVTLGEVYCVDKVVWYWSSFDDPRSWSCTQDECTCEGWYCASYFVSVYTESSTTSGNTPSTAGCVQGNTVKLYREDGDRYDIPVYELVITKLAHCTALDSTWENVVTDPQLPVVHGTPITLGCTAGHTNTGGETATCEDGQIVPTGEPPQCLLMCQDSNMFHKIRAIAFKEARDAFVKELKKPGGPNPNLFSKSWISRKINRSETFVKTNWKRDPYELDC